MLEFLSGVSAQDMIIVGWIVLAIWLVQSGRRDSAKREGRLSDHNEKLLNVVQDMKIANDGWKSAVQSLTAEIGKIGDSVERLSRELFCLKQKVDDKEDKDEQVA